MPRPTQANLHRIALPAPPLPDQRRIAGILGALDDKIELNRWLAETLEAAVACLFDGMVGAEDAPTVPLAEVAGLARDLVTRRPRRTCSSTTTACPPSTTSVAPVESWDPRSRAPRSRCHPTLCSSRSSTPRSSASGTRTSATRTERSARRSSSSYGHARRSPDPTSTRSVAAAPSADPWNSSSPERPGVTSVLRQVPSCSWRYRARSPRFLPRSTRLLGTCSIDRSSRSAERARLPPSVIRSCRGLLSGSIDPTATSPPGRLTGERLANRPRYRRGPVRRSRRPRLRSPTGHMTVVAGQPVMNSGRPRRIRQGQPPTGNPQSTSAVYPRPREARPSPAVRLLNVLSKRTQAVSTRRLAAPVDVRPA